MIVTVSLDGKNYLPWDHSTSHVIIVCVLLCYLKVENGMSSFYGNTFCPRGVSYLGLTGDTMYSHHLSYDVMLTQSTQPVNLSVAPGQPHIDQQARSGLDNVAAAASGSISNTPGQPVEFKIGRASCRERV